MTEQRFELKDSGQRETFATGSRRDTRAGKGRFDLIPPMALRRLAVVYEAGAAKYGDNNWKRGQPLSRFLDSAMRHTSSVAEGLEDEDHAFQAVWNLVGLAWTLTQIRAGRLPVELCDLPFTIEIDCHGTRSTNEEEHQKHAAQDHETAVEEAAEAPGRS